MMDAKKHLSRTRHIRHSYKRKLMYSDGCVTDRDESFFNHPSLFFTKKTRLYAISDGCDGSFLYNKLYYI